MATETTSHNTSIEIRRMGPADVAVVVAAERLFDEQPTAELTRDVLSREGHHLLLAFVGGEAAGFVTGIEIVHPDKALEVLVYELGVDEAFRRRGVATALLRELEAIAASKRARGLWVPTEHDNVAANATYRSIGAERDDAVIYEWEPRSSDAQG